MSCMVTYRIWSSSALPLTAWNPARWMLELTEHAALEAGDSGLDALQARRAAVN